MRFTYRLSSDASGWLAECVETSAAGEGTTPDEAIAQLREALEERLLRPDAVAPPPTQPADASRIELAKAE